MRVGKKKPRRFLYKTLVTVVRQRPQRVHVWEFWGVFYVIDFSERGIHLWDITDSYVPHGAFMCEIWLVHLWNITYFICGTCLTWNWLQLIARQNLPDLKQNGHLIVSRFDFSYQQYFGFLPFTGSRNYLIVNLNRRKDSWYHDYLVYNRMPLLHIGTVLCQSHLQTTPPLGFKTFCWHASKKTRKTNLNQVVSNGSLPWSKGGLASLNPNNNLNCDKSSIMEKDVNTSPHTCQQPPHPTCYYFGGMQETLSTQLHYNPPPPQKIK